MIFFSIFKIRTFLLLNTDLEKKLVLKRMSYFNELVLKRMVTVNMQ